MENNINLDSHSSLIIADGSIVEINGQKVLLTLVKDADAPEPKVIDLHKDSWGVKHDSTQRFYDSVISWMNQNKKADVTGIQTGGFYGHTIEGEYGASPLASDFTHILTLDEFCAIAYPETSEKNNQWVRCIKDFGDVYTSGKWYQQNHQRNMLFFDLSNPLDYNPETLIGKYYEGNQIESIYFDHDEAMIPRFKLSNGIAVLCKSVTPSDVTDTPPLPSLKYEDCFERLSKEEQTAILGAFFGLNCLRKTNPLQAKQLAATIKLMTIMHDANEGWIPKVGEMRMLLECDQERNKILFDKHQITLNSPIYFRDKETAQRAYEANKEIFHEYFGVGGENE